MKHFNNLKQWCLLPIVMVLATIPALAQLNGTYTIGGASPSYATLSAAVTDLMTKGVSGPVTFNIRTGSYSDKALLGTIPGVSATKRVTFKSETGNAADVTISATGSTSTDDYIFKLLNTSYVTIRNLTMTQGGTSYGNGVEIFGTSSYDSILNNVINLPAIAGTSLTNAGIQAYGPSYGTYLSGTDNVVKNNSIYNGCTAIALYGNGTGAMVPNFVFEGNLCSNQTY